jgi:hypothetical protein
MAMNPRPIKIAAPKAQFPVAVEMKPIAPMAKPEQPIFAPCLKLTTFNTMPTIEKIGKSSQLVAKSPNPIATF